MLGIVYINHYYITYLQYFGKGVAKGAHSFLAGAGVVAHSFYYEGAGVGAPLHFLARSGSAASFCQERAHHCWCVILNNQVATGLLSYVSITIVAFA